MKIVTENIRWEDSSCVVDDTVSILITADAKGKLAGKHSVLEGDEHYQPVTILADTAKTRRATITLDESKLHWHASTDFGGVKSAWVNLRRLDSIQITELVFGDKTQVYEL